MSWKKRDFSNLSLDISFPSHIHIILRVPFLRQVFNPKSFHIRLILKAFKLKVKPCKYRIRKRDLLVGIHLVFINRHLKKKII